MHLTTLLLAAGLALAACGSPNDVMSEDDPVATTEDAINPNSYVNDVVCPATQQETVCFSITNNSIYTERDTMKHHTGIGLLGIVHMRLHPGEWGTACWFAPAGYNVLFSNLLSDNPFPDREVDYYAYCQ